MGSWERRVLGELLQMVMVKEDVTGQTLPGNRLRDICTQEELRGIFLGLRIGLNNAGLKRGRSAPEKW